MPTNPSPTGTDPQSIKLSVTVKKRLEDKYKENPDALEQIEVEIKKWIKADGDRGIQTVHVHVDDSTEMGKQGVQAVVGEATPEKIKQAIDDLWEKLTPDYLVLFGGHDIVPMFKVTNPTYLWEDEDNDKTVLTDNPYASSAFSPADQNSYLVPDRVIGRIPDMVSDPDPSWFVEYLQIATNWEPKCDDFYKDQYVICTDEAKDAGLNCAKKAFPTPTLPLLICPPDSDVSPPPSNRLLSPLHMIKCHGNKKDAAFWGLHEFERTWSPAITSAILKELPRLAPSTLVGAMCCYGAQIFSPSDRKVKPPGAWPMASTYLRKGALGFVGPTMKAWVGRDKMSGADIIVTYWLKSILEGESIGLALLKSKQDYHTHDGTRGQVVDVEGEKTLIEYVLLGDPSIHPVKSSLDSANELVVQERRQRRVARQITAAAVRKLLPTRSPATDEDEAKALAVFASDMATKARESLKGFSIDQNAVHVQKVDTGFPDLPAIKKGPAQSRQALEYYWRGKRDYGGHKQLCLLRVETDRQRRPWRASVMYTS
jgi:Peptidase family C25